MLFLARINLALPRGASCHLFMAPVNTTTFEIKGGKIIEAAFSRGPDKALLFMDHFVSPLPTRAKYGEEQEKWLVIQSQETTVQLGATLESARRILGQDASFIPENGCLYLPGIRYPIEPSMGSTHVSIPTICAEAASFNGQNPPTDRDLAYTARMKNKIKTMLHAARDNGYTTVVILPFGCGSLNHSPQLIARLIKQVITQEFQGWFKKVVFSIQERDPAILTAFQQTFIS